MIHAEAQAARIAIEVTTRGEFNLELTRVVATWAILLECIRRAILTLTGE